MTVSPRGKVLLALGVTAALTALEIWRLGPPAVAPADAPAAEFSATRAIDRLRKVSIDAPHPLGTPAHDEVRDRIAAEMTALGYTVEIQRGFACNASATCGDVANVIATRPGHVRGRPAIAVAAHYDSVGAGPGASDDGTGVGTLIEIARAIRDEPLANPVVFFIDDGEETGLLGAEVFVADAARGQDVGLVINLEARGTSGTPFMFETSADSRWMIPIVAGALPRPATSSLFAAIYDRLPNDTDLTVFKRDGRSGINFAYVGDASQYHTPLDNLANVDAGSVQHRGEQALAMVRAFGNARLEGRATAPRAAPGAAAAPASAAPGTTAEAAVWFDVFSLFIVWWPAGWSVAISALAIAMIVAAIVLGRRRGEVAIGGVLLGLVSFVASVALAYGLGTVLVTVLRQRAPGALFPPYPEPAVAAAWVAGITAAVAVAGLVRRRASFDALLLGHALAWNVLAVALTQLVPGAAYVAVVPGLVLAAGGLIRIAARTGEELPSIAGLVSAAAVFFVFALSVHVTLGGASIPLSAVMLGLVGTTFAPMFAPSRPLVSRLLVLAVALGVVAMLVPGTTPSHPRHLSLAHATDGDTGAARWQVDTVTPAVRAAAAFEPTRQSIAPWLSVRRGVLVAPAPSAGLAAPQATVSTTQSGELRITTVELTSPRGAQRVGLAWRSDAPVESIRINGVTPPPPTRSRPVLTPGWHRAVVRGSSAKIEITTRAAAPAGRGAPTVEAYVSDQSFGLPAFGVPLAILRDLSGAVPVHDGDVTTIQRRITW